MRRRSGRPALLFAVLVLALAAAGACSPERVVESYRVLDDIQAGAKPSALKDSTDAPTRQPIRFEIEGRPSVADLYLPAVAPKARLVLVPGVTPQGRDDPRVVEFAETLARARFQVLVPDLPRMRALTVSADDAVPIADALYFLDTQRQRQPLGLAAISFAVGPAVLALFEPQAAGRVDFVLTVGGYYDLTALIRYITTGYYRKTPDGPWLHRPPKAYGKWIFVLSNAPRIENAADRDTLIQMARRKLDSAKTDVSDLAARLGPDGRAVYALVENTDPDAVASLLAGLPSGIVEETRRLDLAERDLSTVTARFVMIHDQADRIIPPGHTTEFAAALPPGQAETYYLGSIDHAEPKPPGPADAFKMLQAVYAVLTLRDSGGQAD
jgi:pimeloyl-ACP methyl ester carboxylesterase